MICYLGSSIVFSQFALIFMGTFHYLSWDIMEPICYLMTFGNFTAGFFFYTMCRKDLDLTNFNEILTHRLKERACLSQGIDLGQLEEKKQEIAQMRR